MVYKYTTFLGVLYNQRGNDTLVLPLVLPFSSLTCSHNHMFVPMRELSKARTNYYSALVSKIK